MGKKGDDAPREPLVVAQTASVRAEAPFDMDPTERQVVELPGNKQKGGRYSVSENNLWSGPDRYYFRAGTVEFSQERRCQLGWSIP